MSKPKFTRSFKSLEELPDVHLQWIVKPKWLKRAMKEAVNPDFSLDHFEKYEQNARYEDSPANRPLDQ